MRYEVRRLREGIRKHRDCSGHDLCWYHPELWSLLPEKGLPAVSPPPWDEFLAKCATYRASFDGNKKIPNIYKYPRPSVTVDNIIYRRHLQPEMDILFIRRKNDPYKGALALPGGFLEKDEDLRAGALRELREETGIQEDQLRLFRQLGAYGAPGRDPRGWTVSVAFIGFVSDGTVALPGDDAAEVEWVPSTDIESMFIAFDHAQIIEDSKNRLQFLEGERAL